MLLGRKGARRTTAGVNLRQPDPPPQCGLRQIREELGRLRRENRSLALREQVAPAVRQGEFGFTSGAGTAITLLAYDELYPQEVVFCTQPPGRGRHSPLAETMRSEISCARSDLATPPGIFAGGHRAMRELASSSWLGEKMA